MKNGKVVLGVLAGLATGAFLGILFAPDKGSNTRKKIKQKSQDYADELGHKFNDMVDGISRKFKSAQQEAEEAVEDIKKKAAKAKNETAAAAGSK